MRPFQILENSQCRDMDTEWKGHGDVDEEPEEYSVITLITDEEGEVYVVMTVMTDEEGENCVLLISPRRLIHCPNVGLTVHPATNEAQSSVIRAKTMRLANVHIGMVEIH